MRHALKLSASVAVLAALAGAPALAQDGEVYGPTKFYSEGRAGAAFYDLDGVDTETGYSIAGAFGYRYTDTLRAEVELGYSQADFDETGVDGDISALTLMTFGYYDFNAQGTVRPYVGLGLGAANVNVDASTVFGNVDGDEWVFAYGARAGIETDLGFIPGATGSIGYRFTGLEDGEFRGAGLKGELQGDIHVIEAGIRIPF